MMELPKIQISKVNEKIVEFRIEGLGFWHLHVNAQGSQVLNEIARRCNLFDKLVEALDEMLIMQDQLFGCPNDHDSLDGPCDICLQVTRANEVLAEARKEA
jgi:hypothetical protein